MGNKLHVACSSDKEWKSLMTIDFMKSKICDNIREIYWNKNIEVFKTQIIVDLSKID